MVPTDTGPRLREPFPQMPGARPGIPQLPFPAPAIAGGTGELFAYLLEKRIGDRQWDWFMYSASWLPLAIAAPLTARSIQIDSDADFLALACTGVARAVASPAAQNADTPFLVTMRNSGTGADLFDAVQDWTQVVGTAQRPAWWGLPRLMPLGSTLVVSLQSLDAATAWNVRLGFWGIKVYASSTR